MAAPIRHACRRYLLHFAHDHLEFRLPELVSVGNIFDIQFDTQHYLSQSPFMVVDLPTEDCARQIASRSILLKCVYELWGQGSNYSELLEDIKNFPQVNKEPYYAAEKSFCVRVETFNKILTMAEKIKKIDHVLDGAVPLEGKVNLKKPDISFGLMEDYGSTSEPQSLDHPQMIYFGRWVADGQRDCIRKYDLQKRKFIGNTSMEAGLSLIMANMGQTRPASLVYDPFVGTGSLLVSSAHFGAYVMGTEIDKNLLHGRGKNSRHNVKWRSRDENIRSNLAQYGLSHLYVDAFLADASKSEMWRQQSLFDTIITDPPYGIREKTTKVGASDVADGYALTDILLDLLNFAAKYLRLGGRLVYWLPAVRAEYTEANVPRHPCLELIANSEQVLNLRVSRRLITMQKVKEYEDGDVTVLVENPYKSASFRDKYFQEGEASCKTSEEATHQKAEIAAKCSKLDSTVEATLSHQTAAASADHCTKLDQTIETNDNKTLSEQSSHTNRSHDGS